MLVKKRESARSDNAQSAGSLAPVAGVSPLQRDCTKRSPREPAKCIQSVRAVKMIFLLFTLVRARMHMLHFDHLVLQEKRHPDAYSARR
jgi:hypothetical protein